VRGFIMSIDKKQCRGLCIGTNMTDIKEGKDTGVLARVPLVE